MYTLNVRVVPHDDGFPSLVVEEISDDPNALSVDDILAGLSQSPGAVERSLETPEATPDVGWRSLVQKK